VIELLTLPVQWPPLKMGWWDTVGGGAVVNSTSDSTYLRATQPPWQEDWHWSTWFGSGGIHQFLAHVPSARSGSAAVLRVRIRARARIEQGTYFEPTHMRGRLFWQARLGDDVKWSGKSMTTTFDGHPSYGWHDIVTPWMNTDPRGRPWTFRNLRRTRFLMGRTGTYGRMWVSRMWFEVEVPVPRPNVPDMDLTGPVGPIRTTSRPDVTWSQSGEFTQAAWEVEVHEGAVSARRADTLVAASGRNSDTRDRWTIGSTLDPQGVYTVFGRVARDWGGELLWSSWESHQFEMAIDPPDPVTLTVEPQLHELAALVTWPLADVGGFGLDPFGIAPFGGVFARLEIQSADTPQGPWVDRTELNALEGQWLDRFVPFNEPRFYRARTLRELEDSEIASVPSEPAEATLEVDAPSTAAITDAWTGEMLLVQLRGKPLTPSLQSRMQIMAAADLDVTVAQGQPPSEHYEGQFQVTPEDFDRMRQMLRNPGVLVWRDAYRYRHPFVWSSDMAMDPLVARSNTPHIVDFRMTVVPWPERLH